MNKEALNVLCCPSDKGKLCLYEGNFDTGSLKCLECDSIFPIINGIPRILNGRQDELTKAAFSVEWDELKDELPWGDNSEERILNVFKSLCIDPSELNDKFYLDVGCGDGSKIGELSKYGKNLYAIDITSSLERGHQKYGNIVNYVQSDFRMPPFKNETFDILWAGGTIHHTPDPKKTFMTLVDLLKPGGIFYVWLYKKAKEKRLELIKHKIVRKSNTSVQKFLINLLSAWALVAQEIRYIIGKLNVPRKSWRQMKHGIRDQYTVPYYWSYLPEEVESWFKESRLKIIYTDAKNAIRILGKKP